MPAGRHRLLIAFFPACYLLIMPVHAGVQERLVTVETLYFAAKFEEALAELDRLEQQDRLDTPEADQYKALCLLALGQVEAAQRALENLLRRNSNYQPDPRWSSPRLQEQFAIVRERLLPELVRATYTDAKAMLTAKKYQEAAVRFQAVLDLLRNADEPAFSETRALASQFLDLATLASDVNAAAVPVGTSGQSSPGTTETTTYDVSSTDVVPPTALGPLLPQPSPDVTVPRTPGLFEILIDESGRVESATVRRSISSQYDARVINEARNWRFKPATRNGEPVKFRKLIEIYAVPEAQVTR